MILFEKFGQHQPLNRQIERYALEGVPISLSTAADAIGASCAVLEPLLRLVESHVMAAERLHGDDTTVPVLALGKCDVGRCWVYGAPTTNPLAARPRRPRSSTTRAIAAALTRMAHLARYSGILQADAFGGYTKLYEPQRSPGPIQEAACWVHARRPFFAMADLEENARRKAAGQEGNRHLPDCDRDRPPDRRPVRDRAVHQWPKRRNAKDHPPGIECRAGGGVAGLYGGAAG